METLDDFKMFGFEQETKTKHGIDKLEILVRFMPMLDEKSSKKKYNAFKKWLQSELKRPISNEEEKQLLEAILRYIVSDPATQERIDAMNELFNLEFIN